MSDAYTAFLEAKICAPVVAGFDVAESDVNPALRPHCRAIARWAVSGGRRAIFAAFGLHKTSKQLEIMRLIRRAKGGLQLIVAPLNVRREFRKERDARFAHAPFDVALRFVQSDLQIDTALAEGFSGVFLTNYESVREGKITPDRFNAVSLDEASVLRGFGGTKTFREFMRLFDRVPYRFVATATPSPNEYIELLAYSAFLGVMDVGEAKTRFFRRNSEKADELTLHPHKEREFWLWVASWAVMLQRPSDLGFSDEGYVLPSVRIVEHEVAVDHSAAEPTKWGQGRLFRETTASVVDTAREKRDTIALRVARLREILADQPSEHWIIWHDLEAERAAIEKAVPGVRSVWGSQDLDDRERAVEDFSEGRLKHLAGKPVMLGSGCNLQHHCARAAFLGIGPKFNDFIQAVHRIVRFGQTREVEIHLIFAESEQPTLRLLKKKWAQHEDMVAKMSEIIREYGLNRLQMADVLRRSMFDQGERVEASGQDWRLVRNDCVRELANMAGDSVDLIVTSIPFSTQYEYTPSYNDFGHTDSNAHFWEQMDFLIPQLLRVLKPGRDAVIHVKDRVVPGGMKGLGFQTVYRFSDACCDRFEAHGFAFLARKTNVTDVVRENNQTYRLGWSEQCKDGSRMGAGMPEYVLVFRKAPSDRSDGYADVPVLKSKEAYTRARWQIDAHGYQRSSGDRLLTPADLIGLPADVVYRTWRAFSFTRVYDYDLHVRIGEALDAAGQLPPTFMLLPPASWSEDVWADTAQMLSLNTKAAQQGAEKHLCPLPFDIVDRAIIQYSQPGELVFDPFAGLGTVPYQALKHGRRGLGVELNPNYFADACAYLMARERELATPSLFDFLGERPLPGEAANASDDVALRGLAA